MSSAKKNRRFGEDGKTQDAQVLWSLAVAVGVAVLAVMSLKSPSSIGTHRANGGLNRMIADASASQSLPE